MLRPYTKAIRAWDKFFDGPFYQLAKVLENAIAEMENNIEGKYSGVKAGKEIEKLKDMQHCLNEMGWTHRNWVNGF